MALFSVTVLLVQIALVASDAQVYYRLSDLEKQVASLTSHTSKYEQRNDEQMTALTSRVSNNQKTLDGEMAALTSRVSNNEKKHERQVTALTSRVSSSDKKRNELERTVKVISVKEKELEWNLEGLKDDISNAFAVVLSRGGRSSGIIKYNYVRYNHGNHYSTSTGIYTVPSSGVYFFQVNIETSGAGYAYLRQNGSNRLRAFSPNVSGLMGSKSIIFYARKGDKIGVYRGSSSHYYYGSAYDAYNSFLGMRLF